jgi:hypothetical protein
MKDSPLPKSPEQWSWRDQPLVSQTEEPQPEAGNARRRRTEMDFLAPVIGSARKPPALSTRSQQKAL